MGTHTIVSRLSPKKDSNQTFSCHFTKSCVIFFSFLANRREYDAPFFFKNINIKESLLFIFFRQTHVCVRCAVLAARSARPSSYNRAKRRRRRLISFWRVTDMGGGKKKMGACYKYRAAHITRISGGKDK